MKENEPSTTALLIAKSQLLLADDRLLASAVDGKRAQYYQRFVESVTSSPFKLTAFIRLWLRLMERFAVSGMYLHFSLRKRCIEKIARQLIAQNEVQQVVVLAAGSDPLAALLSAEYANLAFFELDHPATQRAKKKALESIGLASNLSLVPIDFTKQTTSDALASTSFSWDKPALFIAEGITMYLDDAQVEAFFAQIKSCISCNGGYCLFTYMNKQANGSIQFEGASKLVGAWLHLKNEVFKWGIANHALLEFLKKMGYVVISVHDADYLTSQYLIGKQAEAAALARGENICLARVQ